MELHRLSFLVITILVSHSAQDVYKPSNDIYSHNRGYPNVMPYELNNRYNHKCNVEENYVPYLPVLNVDNNREDLLALRSGPGRKRRLKLQQEETRKLKKLLSAVKTALPPLVKLLKYDGDEDSDSDSS